MAILVTELISRAREYADSRDDGDDPYIGNTAALLWLNHENRRLVRRLARLKYAWGEISTSFTSSTTVTDTSTVVAITGVFETSGDLLVPLPRRLEGAKSISTGRYWTAAKTAAGVQTITVGETGTYTLKYIPTPEKLVTGTPAGGESDRVYYPAGWEEILVLGAALRMKAKEGADNESPFLRQLYKDEWDEIEVEAANADSQQTVLNVDYKHQPGYSGTNFTTDWYWL
jgi:hypothetical protein